MHDAIVMNRWRSACRIASGGYVARVEPKASDETTAPLDHLSSVASSLLKLNLKDAYTKLVVRGGGNPPCVLTRFVAGDAARRFPPSTAQAIGGNSLRGP